MEYIKMNNLIIFHKKLKLVLLQKAKMLMHSAWVALY